MKKITTLLLSTVIMITSLPESFGQGVGFPSDNWGIGFGNTQTFTGLRFNAVDKDIDRIIGVNLTAWYSKPFEDQSGSFSGLGIGLPLAIGTEDRFGASLGILGVGATEKVYGLNVAGLGVGGDKVIGVNIAGVAVGGGEYLKGINIGGVAVGAGSDLKGINIGGLGAGAGNDVVGINIGGLGVGAGHNMSGLNISALGAGSGNNVTGVTIGGLGAGSGNNLSGISIGGLGLGAGKNASGLNIGGLGVGAGSKINGLSLAGLGLGAGESINGLAIAGLGIGSPSINGVTISLLAGGVQVKGLILAPGYFSIRNDYEPDLEAPVFKGLSVSAFNHLQGDLHGVTIGVFNYAYRVKGVQIGVLNYNRNNPRGLRLLPIFNTNFRRKSS